MREFLSRLNWILSEQFGISVLKLLNGLRRGPWFFSQYRKFKKQFKDDHSLLPCLHDIDSQSGSVDNEYFWQDLHVAQQIAIRKPLNHLDIGSRIDGFVAHVAAFRKIDVGDIRPLTNKIPNVSFQHVDLTSPNTCLAKNYQSVSCLHTLEHIGLGRYGDVLDEHGWQLAIQSLAKLVCDDGRLYLSVPVGRPKVYFNAHRVFDFEILIDELKAVNLEAQRVWFINPKPDGIEELSILDAKEKVVDIQYTLAIFDCVKHG